MSFNFLLCGLVFFDANRVSFAWCTSFIGLTTKLGICRSRISLSFPLLDSFPRIFAPSGASQALSVNTSLCTDTTVAFRIKALQQIVNRAIGIDEREALSNSLGEIAEGYEEGWESGTDEDDD